MGEYLIQESTLLDIANAIRSALDAGGLVAVADMADKIRSIPDVLLKDYPEIEGATVTLDASTTSYDILKGRHDGTGKVQIKTETKEVTPFTSKQTLVPSTNSVITKVEVDAIKTQTKSVVPGTSVKKVTPDNGYFLSQVDVEAVKTQVKSVSPGSSPQTVTPDDGYFLSQVDVGVCEKQIYSGTATLNIPEGYDRDYLDTGITLQPTDIFVMVNDDTAGLTDFAAPSYVQSLASGGASYTGSIITIRVYDDCVGYTNIRWYIIR